MPPVPVPPQHGSPRSIDGRIALVTGVAGPTPATKPGEKPRTAISLDCSKQADAKGLHGKERKKFREECKMAAKKN